MIDAATSFYNYYNAQSGAYQTGNISVVRTSDFDKLVTSCRNIFSGRYAEEYMVDPSEYGLDVQALEYLTSPYQYSFLYDLADYVSVLDESNTLDTTSIVYKDTTPKSFFAQPYRSMPIDTYCGLSIYVPQTKNPKMNEWYKQLKWYKAVYE